MILYKIQTRTTTIANTHKTTTIATTIIATTIATTTAKQTNKSVYLFNIREKILKTTIVLRKL